MKKSLLFIGFFAFALLFLTNIKSNAQQCLCSRPNNDYSLIDVYLGDINQAPLPPTFECTTLGQETKVYLWVVLQGNATRYSLFAHYNLFLDNVQTKVFDGHFYSHAAIPTNTPILVDTIKWPCGAEVKLDNYYMAWQQNKNDTIFDCTVTPHGCYAAPGPIIVNAPLIPRYTYTGECSTGNYAKTMTFTSISTGGTPYKKGDPYSYLWNFGPSTDYVLVPGYSLSTSPTKVTFVTPGDKVVYFSVADSINPLIYKTTSNTVTVDPCLHISANALPGNFPCSDVAGISNWISTHGGAAVTGATGTVTWTYSPNPYTLTGGCAPYTGKAVITFVATDQILSVSSSATLTITDTQPPVITKPAAGLTVECDGAGNVTAYNNWLTSNAGATASDACDASLTWSYTAGSWATDCGNAKHISVAFWATDDCGNKSTETSATFTIQDTTPPAITKQASVLTVECDGTGNTTQRNAWLASGGGATATDVCNSITWHNNFTGVSDACGNTGTATVTFWATDCSGNKSSETSALFTIVDTTAPSFPCPGNLQQAADHGKNYATVIIRVPDVMDDCSTSTPTLVNSKTGTNDASGQYPIGTTYVTYTATDNCGNQKSCTFSVKVVDEQAPVINCPGDRTVSCIGDVPAPLTTYADFVSAGGSATDNQGLDLSSFILLLDASDKKSCPETITRVYEIRDLTGTVASCTQTIIVWDKEAPNFTTAPANVTIQCGGSTASSVETWLSVPKASDNCGIKSFYNNYQGLTDGCGNTGSATVTWTVEDNCGNKTTATATVWVVDTTGPDFETPANLTVQANAKCEYNASPEITGMPRNLSDNCASAIDLTITGYKDSMVPGSKSGDFVLTRTWTVADPCGNKTSKNQTILIQGAKVPPELILHPTCVYLTKYGKWTLNESEMKFITSGSHSTCGAGDDMTFTFDDRAFSCYDATVGKKLITVTATDSNGGVASGTVWITVADTLKPIAVCKDATLYLDKFGQAFLSKEQINKGYNGTPPDWAVFFNKGNDGSYDNCGIADIFLNRQLFTCADLAAPKPVIMTAVDPSGNTAICVASVTVLDTIKPVIKPIANLTVTVPPGTCSTKVNYPDITVTDNCGVSKERLAGLGPDGMFPINTTTTETWKVTNIGGTFSMISFTVTVNTYNGAPTINPVADLVIPEDTPAMEISLPGISYGLDCMPQKVFTFGVTNSNPGLLTVGNPNEWDYESGTGLLDIVPLKDKNGEAIITITLKDDGGTANGGVDTKVITFKITVTPVNDPPTVKPIPDQVVTLPNTLSVNVKGAFSDVDEGDVLTFVVTKADGSALPSWMTWNPTTGLLTGSPTLSNLGVVNIKATATDKAGASVSDEFRVIVLEANASILVVNVVKGTSPVTAGVNVLLFVKNGTMFDPVANTPVVEGNTFTFYNVAKSTFIIKAVNDPAVNPGLLNTWYESSVSLTGATQLAITAAGTKTVQINMVTSNLAVGTYKIMGKVIRRTGTPNPNVPPVGPGTPAPGIDLLLKLGGNVVATTITGTDGTYAFDKLPAGDYEVAVELAGYTQDAVRKVTVSSAVPLADKIDFTIWTADNTHVITKISDLTNSFGMKIYPNPTTGKVNIDITWKNITDADVIVYNMLGAEVFHQKFFNGEKIIFNLSENSTGEYMVKVKAGDFTKIDKLIIDRR
jgi:hypothetical protein